MSLFRQAPLTADGISAMAAVARKQGAVRMRRRIRAKQREALAALHNLSTDWDFPEWVRPMVTKRLSELDAATRSAPRKGRAK